MSSPPREGIARRLGRLRWRLWVERELRASRRLGRSTRPVGTVTRAYVVTPAPPGSTGDESFVLAVLRHLRRAGVEAVLVRASAREPWDAIAPGVATATIPRHPSARTRRAVRRFTRSLGPRDAVLYLGVDVACGGYGRDAVSQLALVHAAARAGARAAVISLGFDAAGDPLALRALAALPPHVPLVARDRGAQAAAAATLRREVALGADVAFIFDAEEANGAVPARPAPVERAFGRPTVVVNVHALLLGVSPFASDAAAGDRLAPLAGAVAEALGTVVEEDGVSIALLPHDDRGPWSDVALARLVAARLDARHRSQVRVLDRLSAEATRALCREADAVIAGRMHLAIACLANEVPLGALTYQTKFAGLLEELQLSRWSVPGEAIVAPGPLVELIRSVRRDRALIVEHMETHVPALRDRALRNFDVLSEGDHW